MGDWFYVRDGQQQGPVEAVQIISLVKGGQLPQEANVWKQGMPNWVSAKSLPEFAALNEITPSVDAGSGVPPIPAQSVVPPIIPSSDVNDAEVNKGIAIVAYLIFFIPLIVAPKSPFARPAASKIRDRLIVL